MADPLFTIVSGRPEEHELAALTVVLLACLRRSEADAVTAAQWADWPGADAHQPPDWSAPPPDPRRPGTGTSAEGL